MSRFVSRGLFFSFLAISVVSFEGRTLAQEIRNDQSEQILAYTYPERTSRPLLEVINRERIEDAINIKRNERLPRLDHRFFTSPVATKAQVGFSKQGRPIDVYYFPGKSGKRALIIGGVHGSELSSIEVANELVNRLSEGEQPYYSTVVIPCLFPDNAAKARNFPAQAGGVENIGRYTSSALPDPNRQMPTLGHSISEGDETDHLGRAIEMENRMMLEIINNFKPERIVNIHAIRDTGLAGIYADPRTDHEGIALGFENDSSLAIAMARLAQDVGGYVPGNNLAKSPTAVYYKDPVPVAAGQAQPRNTKGSKLPQRRGEGISLGSWASTAVVDPINPLLNREAITIITVEFPGYKSSDLYSTSKEKVNCRKQIASYAKAITDVFLASIGNKL